jgi:hypothetical protein
MDSRVAESLILASAILAGVGLWIYFSPYQECVRAEYARSPGGTSPTIEARCAAAARQR